MNTTPNQQADDEWECPRCDDLNDDSVASCSKCGQEHPEETALRERHTAFRRQEELSSALWGFAYDLQHDPHDCRSADGTSVNLAAVRRAQDIILRIFGQERVCEEDGV